MHIHPHPDRSTLHRCHLVLFSQLMSQSISQLLETVLSTFCLCCNLAYHPFHLATWYAVENTALPTFLYTCNLVTTLVPPPPHPAAPPRQPRSLCKMAQILVVLACLIWPYVQQVDAIHAEACFGILSTLVCYLSF